MGIIQSREEREAAKEQKRLKKLRTGIRKPEEVSKQYSILCSEAGDKEYKIKCLKMELDQIYQQLSKMNQEFHKAQEVWARTEAEKKSIIDSTKPAHTEEQKIAAAALAQMASNSESEHEAQSI